MCIFVNVYLCECVIVYLDVIVPAIMSCLLDKVGKSVLYIYMCVNVYLCECVFV